MPNPDALDQSTPSTSVRRARARKHRWPRILFLSTISLLILVPLVAGISVLWLRLAAQAALPVPKSSCPQAPVAAYPFPEHNQPSDPGAACRGYLSFVASFGRSSGVAGSEELVPASTGGRVSFS